MLINNIKISILIPVYNMELYISHCMDSIVNQTLKDIEIICIDDGSTDNSLNLLKTYSVEDDRIIIIEQKNQGAGVARNSGLDIATGEYIAFMDPDDFYFDDSVLLDLYEASKKSKCKIVGGSLATYVDEKFIFNFTDEKRFHVFNSEEIIKFSDYQRDYFYQKFIYKREFLVKYNIKFPHYRRYQDPPFLTLAMVKAEKFYVIKRITYIYRESHKKVNWDLEKANDMLNGVFDVMKLSIDNNLSKLLEMSIHRFIYYKFIYSEFLLTDIVDNSILNTFLRINKILNLKNSLYNTSILNNSQKNDIILANKDTKKFIEKYKKGIVRK